MQAVFPWRQGTPRATVITRIKFSLDVHFINPSPVFCLDKTGGSGHPQTRHMDVLPAPQTKDRTHANPLCAPSEVGGQGTDPVGVARPCACHPPVLGVPLSADPAGGGTRSCISTLRINIPRSFRARASSCRSCRLPVPASDICGVPGVVQGCRALHDGSSTTGAATMRQAKRQMLWCCHAGCLVWSTRLHETVAACASPEAWHPW